MEVRLVSNVRELVGTCYFEFLPRKYDGICWNPDSVYVDEEAVIIFEAVLARHVPDYDHFSFSEANLEEAGRLADGLIAFAERVEQAQSLGELRDGQGCDPLPVDVELERNWATVRPLIASMLRELGAWIRSKIPGSGVLSVLGM